VSGLRRRCFGSLRCCACLLSHYEYVVFVMERALCVLFRDLDRVVACWVERDSPYPYRLLPALGLVFTNKCSSIESSIY